nr:MAG TPA: hypothetical protein [Caudoviricetes sp.]
MKKKAGEQPSWDDLTREAFKVKEMSCTPEGLRRVKASHIEDEEQSVKWNREWVEKNNARYLEEVKRLHTEKNAAWDRWEVKVAEKIKAEVGGGLSAKQATAIRECAFRITKGKNFRDTWECVKLLIELAKVLRRKESTEGAV